MDLRSAYKQNKVLNSTLFMTLLAAVAQVL